MNKSEIIKKTENYVKKIQLGESSGHDWWHTYRVWKTAVHIAKEEKADIFIVQIAALLHDIADWKFHNNDHDAGSKAARKWLNKLKVDKKTIDHICGIIDNVSYKGAGVKSKIKTIEGQIVQDADRLDALGAIGIARCFAYGGYDKREIHNPMKKLKYHKTFAQYKNGKSTSLNHFYEKLLLLKNLMNTNAGKKMARQRHAYMENYLKKFYNEWEGKE